MVTCKVDSVAVPKMNSVRNHKQQPPPPTTTSSSKSSGFRRLDGDHLERTSSVSRNSIYKLKIDLMFDDTRSVRSNRLDDPRGSHRTRSIIMYGRSELASTASAQRSVTSILQESNDSSRVPDESTKKDVRRINNSVQAQIEQLFTDVAKDATSSFAVTCLGALPLKDKVTSLQGLQVPLRELYINELMSQRQKSGHLDICATGLRVKISANSPENNVHHKSNNHDNNNETYSDSNITPFHNIAVWSAVIFVLSEDESGAAFLPLITDPENIDKSMLFQPLSSSERKRVASSAHAPPIFAVVMRSAEIPKLLECHGFICKSAEDAIVIAATLYQSLMAHVNANSQCSTKRRTPRNQNGVSCISIASSSAQTASNHLWGSQCTPSGRKSSFHSSSGSHTTNIGGSLSALPPAAMRSMHKKRIPPNNNNNSSRCSINMITAATEAMTEERKRKSHKTKRAPPVPSLGPSASITTARTKHVLAKDSSPTMTYGGNACLRSSSRMSTHHSYPQENLQQLTKSKYTTDTVHHPSERMNCGSAAASASGSIGIRSETNGDILTRVAIPRSGSFLNTGGLTRYKSRAARRHTDKVDDDGDSGGGGGGDGGGGGGGGSPLGFSELFNEFRLHENLHSLDDILYAIIDADGMSFNDLKPIYKEFLLKLAVTLTKDELYQRSKNIMRRQKKKKVKRKNSSVGCQKKPRMLLFGTKGLKKVFQLDQFRSCRGKPSKPARHKERPLERKPDTQVVIGQPTGLTQQQRSRVVNSGSDASMIRPENGINGLNRNSSSGYVSCSECSYDSEACTCASADRCYCSLRTDQANNKHRRRKETNAVIMARKLTKELQQKQQQKKQQQQQQKQQQDQQQKQQQQQEEQPHFNTPDSSRSGRTNISPTNNSRNNRFSLISCKSDDKCYCSMVEEEPPRTLRNAAPHDEEEHTHSDTTWCDTDSCISASKCYCQRDTRHSRTPTTSPGTDDRQSNERQSFSRQRELYSSRSSNHKADNRKLALDYELFTINGDGKPVQPHEALSVKKSVEAAAIFADVKLRQTTDIKSLCPTTPLLKQTSSRRSGSSSSTSRTSSRKQDQFSNHSNHSNNNNNKCRESQVSHVRKNERNIFTNHSSSCNSSLKSYSADDLLTKFNAMEDRCGAPVKSVANKQQQRERGRDVHQFSLREKHFQNNYQSMKAVSASLEDTLGYLP